MSLGDVEQKTPREESERERSVENMKEEGSNRCRAHVFAKTTGSQVLREEPTGVYNLR